MQTFPCLKHSRSHIGTWGTGDYRCPCGSGKLSFWLWGDLGDARLRACPDCERQKIAEQRRQRKEMKTL